MTTETQFTTEEILERLQILLGKEDQDGMHVRANTVWLAIEEIKRLKATSTSSGAQRRGSYTP